MVAGSAKGSPPSELSPEVMVCWRGYPLLAIYYGWGMLRASGMPLSMESPEVESVFSLGH
ncbi:hypothetical protein TIFTF001_016477 [Ficus carica]|uniref:Uncharacterized protein n=1 Tax=Ficus carica TaxID=3494 RepID=A0AA88A8X4_FICCA|nr:hypothetical protein TIFTF001_016477 [Ficus carica]